MKNKTIFDKGHFLYNICKEAEVVSTDEIYIKSVIYHSLLDSLSIKSALEKSEYAKDKYDKSGQKYINDADVMTSQRVFINYYIGKGLQPGFNAQARAMLQEIQNLYKQNNDNIDEAWMKQKGRVESIAPFLSFLLVYDTIGNYVPVDKNLTYSYNDHWLYKLKKIMDAMDYDERKNYQHTYYMMDYNYYMKDCENTFFKSGIIKEYNDSEWAMFFNLYAKLIIQRGYRIENRFYDKWTKKHACEVIKAFRAVGLPTETPDEHGLDYNIIGEWEE